MVAASPLIILSGNEFTSFPPELSSALQLTSLDLSKNSIMAIPAFVSALRELRQVNVSENRISTGLNNLFACALLERLIASYNPLPAAEFQGIQNLKQLNVFVADYVALTSFPSGLFSCVNLTTLSIAGHAIDPLPDLSLLKDLSSLDLSGAPLLSRSDRGYGAYMTKEQFVQWAASNPLIDTLGSSVEALWYKFDENRNEMLEEREIEAANTFLFSAFPRANVLPQGIQLLSKLNRLSVARLALVDLAEYGTDCWPQLSFFDVAMNLTLKTLPIKLGDLVHLKDVIVDGTSSLQTPPKEVAKRGTVVILSYLKSIASGSVQCFRTKLMLVGLGGVGKTSLLRALKGEDFVGGSDSTDGICIATWTVPIKNAESGATQEVTFSAWDFAGQTVYYNTHQFFMSHRAIYVLAWNIRMGYQHAGIDFWLNSIACHAPDCPVLVVGTHADQVPIMTIPDKELKRRFPQIRGFYAVGCQSGVGVTELRTDLFQVTLAEKYLGERVPGQWLHLEEAIIRSRSSLGDIASWEALQRVAEEVGLIDEAELSRATQFLHDLGAVFHRSDRALRDLVVLNPQWLVDVMACVVTAQLSEVKDGVLQHSSIPRLWAKYPKELHPKLLLLTELFELTFPIKSMSGGSATTSIVPCLMPHQRPDLSSWDARDGTKTFVREFLFDHLPAGLFGRVQVRLQQFGDSSMMWAHGMVLIKEENIGLLELTANETQIAIRVRGNSPKNLISIATECVESLISQSFPGLTYDVLVPCEDCVNSLIDPPAMLSRRDIHRANNLGVGFLQCQKHFHINALSDLLTLVPARNGEEFSKMLSNGLRELRQVKRGLRQLIVVSYCNKNSEEAVTGGETDVGRAIGSVDPRRIARDLGARGYEIWLDCDVQQKGGHANIMNAMHFAFAVVVCVSLEYANDEACRRTVFYASNTLKRPVIPVVVGNENKWQNTHVGMLIGDLIYVPFSANTSGNAEMCSSSKYKEGLGQIVQRLDVAKAALDPRPTDVFLSYCWKNSGLAVGAEAVGTIDPRVLKSRIEKAGFRCWLDVEQLGSNGLFEDIAQGLLMTKVVVPCISDEYSSSANCAMEFRHANKNLRKPMAVAVVGTTLGWMKSEVGMLAAAMDPVSVSKGNEDVAIEQLVENIRRRVVATSAAEPAKIVDSKSGRSLFQESLEFLQRQLLLHFFSLDHAARPRLFVVNLSKGSADEPSRASLQLLCELPGHWHTVDEGFDVGFSWDQAVSEMAVLAAPTARLLLESDSKISAVFQEEYIRAIGVRADDDSMPLLTESLPEAYGAYLRLLDFLDGSRGFSGLRRSVQSTGEVFWLCLKHFNEEGGREELVDGRHLSDFGVSSFTSDQEKTLVEGRNFANVKKSAFAAVGSAQAESPGLRKDVAAATTSHEPSQNSSGACSLL